MEVIVITFLLIIFPRDAFLLAFKYIYIWKNELFLLCSQIQGGLSPPALPFAQRVPSPHPALFPTDLSFSARFLLQVPRFGRGVLLDAEF